MGLYLLTLTAIAGSTLAVGPEPTPAAQQATQTDEHALLAGPSVAASNVTATTSSFSSENTNEASRMSMAGARLFREALLALRTAPEAVRPTKEQEVAIARLIQTFQQQERAFQRSHGSELRQLRARMNRTTDKTRVTQETTSDQVASTTSRRANARRSAESDRLDRDDAMTDQPSSRTQPTGSQADTMRATMANPRERVAELMAERPSMASIEKPIRALLTTEQSQWINDFLVTKSKEQFEARAFERYRKEAAQQLARQQTRSFDDMIKRLPERMQTYLKSLPEDEREAAIERLRQRRQTDRRTDLAPPQRTKTPPSVEDLNLPTPDSGG